MEEGRATSDLGSKPDSTPTTDDNVPASRVEADISTGMATHNAQQFTAKEIPATHNEATDTASAIAELSDTTKSAECSSSVSSDEKTEQRADATLVSPLACLEEAEADEEENGQREVANLDRTLSDSESANSFSQDDGAAHLQADSTKGESPNSIQRKPRTSHKSCKVYCHQCRQPVTASTKTEKCTKCGIKYCKPCLARRYGTSELSRSMEARFGKGEGKSDNAESLPSPADLQKLANGHGANWVCPKCLDICNCANCRRRKGLSPTGQVYRKVKKMGYSSVHEYLKNDDKGGNEDELEGEETEGEDDDETADKAEGEKSPRSSIKEEKELEGEEHEEETDENLEEENDEDFVDNNASDFENNEDDAQVTTVKAEKAPGMPGGKPIVSQGATILSLGTIVWNRPNFHSKRYLWPASFKSTRKIQSFKDPSRYVVYTSEIVDTGKSGPEFQVRSEDAQDVVFRASTASSVWKKVLQRIKSTSKDIAVSGPMMFGYGSPKVQALIQKLENAEKCTNYIFKDFEKQVAAKRNKKLVPPKKQHSHHVPTQPQATKRFLPPPHRMPRPLNSNNSNDSSGPETEGQRRIRKRQKMLEAKEREITQQLQELQEKLQYLKEKETSRSGRKRKQHSGEQGRQQKRKRTSDAGSDEEDEENEEMSSGSEEDAGSDGEQYEEDEDDDGEEDEDEDYEDLDDEEGDIRVPRKRAEGEERGIVRAGRGRGGGSGRGGRRRSIMIGGGRGSLSRRNAGKQPKLPIVIGSLTVHKIGALPSGCSTKTLDSFHNEKYLWPVGYLSYREYTSVVDPKTKSIYTCEILLAKRRTAGRGRSRKDRDEDDEERGNNDQDEKARDSMDDEESEEDFVITSPDDTDGECFPVFRVTPVDDPDHPAIATSATGAWMQILRRINDRKLDGEKRTNITVSGPYYFGFSHPLVAKLIQEMPDVERCRHYKMQRFSASLKPRRKKRISGKWEEGSEGEDNSRKGNERGDDRSGTEMDDSDGGSDGSERIHKKPRGRGAPKKIPMEKSEYDEESEKKDKDDDEARKFFKKSHNYFKSKFLYSAEKGGDAKAEDAHKETSAASPSSSETAGLSDKEPRDSIKKENSGEGGDKKVGEASFEESEGSEEEEENWGDDGEERCWKDGVEMKTCHRCKKKKDNWTDCPKDKRHRYCNRCVEIHFGLDYNKLHSNPTEFWKDGCPVCTSTCHCTRCKNNPLASAQHGVLGPNKMKSSSSQSPPQLPKLKRQQSPPAQSSESQEESEQQKPEQDQAQQQSQPAEASQPMSHKRGAGYTLRRRKRLSGASYSSDGEDAGDSDDNDGDSADDLPVLPPRPRGGGRGRGGGAAGKGFVLKKRKYGGGGGGGDEKHCHHCHHKKDDWVSCPLVESHRYCRSCVNRHFGDTIADYDDLCKNIDKYWGAEGCPVCCLSCPCASCCRRKKKRKVEGQQHGGGRGKHQPMQKKARMHAHKEEKPKAPHPPRSAGHPSGPKSPAPAKPQHHHSSNNGHVTHNSEAATATTTASSTAPTKASAPPAPLSNSGDNKPKMGWRGNGDWKKLLTLQQFSRDEMKALSNLSSIASTLSTSPSDVAATPSSPVSTTSVTSPRPSSPPSASTTTTTTTITTSPSAQLV